MYNWINFLRFGLFAWQRIYALRFKTRKHYDKLQKRNKNCWFGLHLTHIKRDLYKIHCNQMVLISRTNS